MAAYKRNIPFKVISGHIAYSPFYPKSMKEIRGINSKTAKERKVKFTTQNIPKIVILRNAPV